MERLRQHPDILVAGPYPYEVKLLIYYGLALGVLTRSADRQQSLDPDKMSTALNRFWIGRNPFNDHIYSSASEVREYWEKRLPAKMSASFREIILGYYNAERRGSGGGAYRIFAEKMHPNADMRAATRFMFPDTFEILLVRDPRDTLCSYKEFWGTDVQQAIQLVEHHMSQMSDIRRSGVALVVRYEDLLKTEAATMAAVWDLLGLPGCELPPSVVNAAHQTSGSATSSIGRWRQELTPEELEAAGRWAPFLSEFGYEQ
jgi:hypothetical protein